MNTKQKITRIYLCYSPILHYKVWAMIMRGAKDRTYYNVSLASRARLSKAILGRKKKMHPIIGPVSTGDIGWVAEV